MLNTKQGLYENYRILNVSIVFIVLTIISTSYNNIEFTNVFSEIRNRTAFSKSDSDRVVFVFPTGLIV